mmetsp:Transcript_27195/g.45602  ORF Transcript_27195/g.45602 Transcript_27195/m.45602 type:complete len:215 (-) Transcript_27195:545-1189(-)
MGSGEHGPFIEEVPGRRGREGHKAEGVIRRRLVLIELVVVVQLCFVKVHDGALTDLVQRSFRPAAVRLTRTGLRGDNITPTGTITSTRCSSSSSSSAHCRCCAFQRALGKRHLQRFPGSGLIEQLHQWDTHASNVLGQILPHRGSSSNSISRTTTSTLGSRGAVVQYLHTHHVLAQIVAGQRPLVCEIRGVLHHIKIHQRGFGKLPRAQLLLFE